MTALHRYLSRLRQRAPAGPVTEADIMRSQQAIDAHCLISGAVFVVMVAIAIFS